MIHHQAHDPSKNQAIPGSTSQANVAPKRSWREKFCQANTIFDPRDNLSRVGPSLNPSLRRHVGENHKYLNTRGTNRNGSFRIWGLWKPWKSTKDVRISTVPTSPRNARRGQNGFEPRLAGTSAGTSKEMGNKMRFLFDRSHPLRK